MPKEYSTKFKTEVIKRYQNSESILALSQELRIAQSTIYHWRKEFCSIKAANRIYTPKEFDALSRRLEKLEHEMEIIKRSGYIADVPLQKKLSVLENIYRQADNTYSVHELCEALDIARGTFYNYIFRRADHSKREEAQIELMRLVQQVFDDSRDLQIRRPPEAFSGRHNLRSYKTRPDFRHTQNARTSGSCTVRIPPGCERREQNRTGQDSQPTGGDLLHILVLPSGRPRRASRNPVP